jgi:hypothetical protein
MVSTRTDTDLEQLFTMMPRKLSDGMDQRLDLVAIVLDLLVPLFCKGRQVANDGLVATTRSLLPESSYFVI